MADVTGYAGKWRASGISCNLVNDWDATIDGKYVGLDLSVNGGNTGFFRSRSYAILPHPDIVVAATWEQRITLTGTNNVTTLVGFGDHMTVAASSTGRMFLEHSSGDANWQILMSNPGTKIDTGIPIADNTWYKIRLEYHGSNTPVTEQTTNTSTNKMNFIISVLATGGPTAAVRADVGPLDIEWARYLNAADL